ncbi:hypothetical protein K438DRAFT_1430536, partial [Mycena galopus ATCC 62051]
DEDDEQEGLAESIRVDQGPHVRHEAVDVPDHKNPFSDNSGAENLFFSVLEQVVREEIIPAGYGILADEWEEDAYPIVEILAVGRQMKKNICVSLASPIWLQCATLWAQSLNVLS